MKKVIMKPRYKVINKDGNVLLITLKGVRYTGYTSYPTEYHSKQTPEIFFRSETSPTPLSACKAYEKELEETERKAKKILEDLGSTFAAISNLIGQLTGKFTKKKKHKKAS